MECGGDDLRIRAAGDADEAALLERFAQDPDGRVRVAVATNPATPASLLRRLTGDRDARVVSAIAARPGLPLALQRQLFPHPHVGVGANLLDQEQLDPQVLEWALASSQYCRKAICERDDCPVAVIERLTDDPDPTVRAFALRDPRLSPAFLQCAFHRGALDPEERLSLLANPSAPEALIEQIVAVEPTHTTAILIRALDNPHCPRALLRRALQHEHDVVRLRALQRGACDRALLYELIGGHRGTLRALCGIWPEQLSAQQLAALAGQEHCPTLLRRALARHPHTTVRAAVARAGLTPRRLLERLARDPAEQVRAATAIQIERLSVRAQLSLVGVDSIAVTDALARSTTLAPYVGYRLASSDNGATRAVVARNPAIPPELLVLLALDHAPGVRFAAFSNPKLEVSSVWAKALSMSYQLDKLQTLFRIGLHGAPDAEHIVDALMRRYNAGEAIGLLLRSDLTISRAAYAKLPLAFLRAHSAAVIRRHDLPDAVACQLAGVLRPRERDLLAARARSLSVVLACGVDRHPTATARWLRACCWQHASVCERPLLEAYAIRLLQSLPRSTRWTLTTAVACTLSDDGVRLWLRTTQPSPATAVAALLTA